MTSLCLPVSCRDSPIQHIVQEGYNANFTCWSGHTNLTCDNSVVNQPSSWGDSRSDGRYICNCDGPATLSPDTAARFNVSRDYQATTCPLDTGPQNAPCNAADALRLCEVTHVNPEIPLPPSCEILLVDRTNSSHHYTKEMSRLVCDGAMHSGGITCKCDISNTTKDSSNLTSCWLRDPWGRSTLVDLHTALGQLPSADLDLRPIESLP